MNDILQWGASEIARQIKAGTITPRQAVDAHLARIEQVNPTLNAVITSMADSARATADEQSAHIAQHGTDDLPPLFGVPITIKDCFPVKDVRFTGGSWYLRDQIADADAPAVQALRSAGAIILGKTNLPDMCWSAESNNPLFGRTNNPHDPRHSPGGSSGGEGAIIGAGGSPLGLGSDIAGSVRIPAACCGIVSLKPTGGRISTVGHLPAAPDTIADWNTAGPMARRVEDLALALSVLSQTPTRDHTQIDLRGRRCLVYIRNPIASVRKVVAATVEDAAGTLATAGMEIIHKPDLPMTRLIFAYNALMQAHGNAAFRAALGNGTGYNLVREVGRALRGQGRITPEVMYFTDVVIRLSGYVGQLLGLGSFQRIDQLKQKMLDEMGAGGVLLTPLLITPPPRHGWTYTLPFHPPYTNMFNMLGFPAVVVPVRRTENGLPLAVQVVARPDEDETALAVAAELERVYGGWQMADVS